MEKTKKKFAMDSHSFVWRHSTALFWTAIVLAAALIPLFSPGRYLYRVMSMIGIYSILALGLNLVSGYLGQISIGHAGFYAIGAYVAAILTTRLEVNFFAAALVSILFTALIAMIFGLITMRISGTYLTITTLGFAELVKVILKNWESMTNGSYGIQRIGRPSFFGIQLSTSNGGIYGMIWVAVGLCVLICYALERGRFGRTLRAMREDEIAAGLMGVNTHYYRVLALALSGAFAGFAGACYAHLNGYIDPNIFTQDASMTILCIVILGGMGSVPGMIVGSILLTAFPEVLRGLSEYRFVVYGLLLIFMMRFRPQGILGGRSKKPYRFPRGIRIGAQK